MMRAVSQGEGFDGVPPYLATGELLTSRLRGATAETRQQAMARVGLPGAVADHAGLLACLRRFHELYCPLEARLLAFRQWSGLGIDLAGLSRVVRFHTDVALPAPGQPAPIAAPREALPHLPTFAHAVGGLYALTTFIDDAAADFGSAGLQMAGACRPFTAGETGDVWQAPGCLDHYGLEWPGNITLAIEGAQRSFVAIGRWMDVRHWGAGADR